MLRRLLWIAPLLLVLAAWRLPPDLDETYYWTWSRALDFAYYDHPPAIAWALALSTKIAGHRIGLRLLPLACMAIVALSTVASVQRLVPADRRHDARQLALLSLLGAPMYTLGYLPATPDPLQGAAVALGAYLLVRGAFLSAACALAASILVKHSTALLLLGALPLLPRRAWLGAALGSLALIPWLLADPSTAFQADRLLSTPRGPIAIPMTVGSMMGTLGPLTGALLIPLPFLRLQGRTERALAAGALLLVVGCLAAVWSGSGEANWPMPAMVFALPALVGFLVRRGGRLLSVARAVAAASAVLMMIALLHVVQPFLPFPPVKDRTLRSAGFDDVARAARSTAAEIGATKVIARRYQIASELRYHLQDELTVHELGTSRASQYDRWPRAPLCLGEPAVLVMPGPVIPGELPADPLGPPRPIERGRGGRVLDTYYVTPIRMRADLGACR